MNECDIWRIFYVTTIFVAYYMTFQSNDQYENFHVQLQKQHIKN